MKKFPWFFSLLWLSVLLLMVRLGFWQLDRADEKHIMLEQLNQTEFRTAENYEALNQVKRFETIKIAGQWQPLVAFYLENQFHDGQVGFHVYAVMSFFDGTVHALVNRGWVKDLAAVLEPRSSKNLWTLQQGDWPRPGVQLGEQALSDAPKQQVTYLTEDVTKKWLNERFCGKKSSNDCIILPFIFKLNQQMPDGFVRDWKTQIMPPEKHRAYAIQWFTMSLVLLGLYIVFLRKNHASQN